MIPVATAFFWLLGFALFMVMLSCYTLGRIQGSPRQIVKTNILDAPPLQQHPDAEVVAELLSERQKNAALKESILQLERQHKNKK